MDQKPSVFPTQQERQAALQATEQAKVAAYEAEKAQVADAIYNSITQTENVTPERLDAVEMMRRRTADQMNRMQQTGQVVEPAYAEQTPTSKRVVQDQAVTRNDEQMRLRNEQIRINNEKIKQYQIQANQAAERNNPNANPGLYNQQPQQNNQMINQEEAYANNRSNNYVPPSQPPTQPPVMNGYGDDYGQNPSNIDPYIIQLSQPNYNSPFDVIPLPSEGKLYKNKKPSIRLSYMTTADENILSSPNLLESGQFLEILINRKMLEPDLRYKDLHVGDRNAIMLWIRATGYGEMYPVTLMDENNEPFETEINLDKLATKNLGVDPDAEGLFDFTFPLCKARIKFKLLTCGDTDSIEKMVEADKKKGSPISQANIYTMEHTIVEVNGDRNKSTIREFANAIRIGDAKAFNEYVELIESGIDLNLDVRTPGGGSVKTFLPLNLNFFWPNIRL